MTVSFNYSKYFPALLVLAYGFQNSLTSAESYADYPVSTENPLLRNCQTDGDCDSNIPLKCHQGICKCPLPDTMVLQKFKEALKCYIKLGEKCDVSKDRNNSTAATGCVPHSHCGANGQCTCDKTHFPKEDGTCLQKGVFFHRCASPNECRNDLGYHCINNQCNCDRKNSNKTHIWTRGQCGTMAGHSPLPEDPKNDTSCVANANYNVSTRLCHCNENFTEIEGICTARFGDTCDLGNNVCSPEMICVDGRCECRYSGRLINGTCHSGPHMPCVETIREVLIPEEFGALRNVTIPCVPNAFCVFRRDNRNLRECQCSHGFMPVNGECQLQYSQMCGNYGDTVLCDQSKNLQCINGMCDCPTHKLQYFDRRQHRCMGMVGASCEIGEETGVSKFCTAGATCMTTKSLKDDGTSTVVGRCECKTKYHLTNDRRCKLEAGLK